MILGLSGKARSGKSTCANHLIKNYGFVRVNFKDALIQEMKENLPDTLSQLCLLYEYVYMEEDSIPVADFDELFREKPPIMRALMQNYGTEIRRNDDTNYWTDKWNKTVAKHIEEGKNVVVDDVRFINEADAVKLAGGDLIRIVRVGHESTDNPTHKSETEMDSIVVDNEIRCENGVELLTGAMDAMIEEYEKG